MKLKTYKVKLVINTLEDENAAGNTIISEYLQGEILKKIAEEHMFTDEKGGVVFLFGVNVDSVSMIRSIFAFK